MSRSRHRVPPRPASMLRPIPGACKFCGNPIMMAGKVNRRASWHPACALRWTIMNSPRDARRFVFVRDRGICKRCGAYHGPDPSSVASIIERIMTPPAQQKMTFETVDLGDWELDHIIPLSQAAARGNPLELWQLGNMQTLCPACHVIKSREDRVLYGA